MDGYTPIPSQDYTTYDDPNEFHVRNADRWNGWLILQNPERQEDGSVIGTIVSHFKATEPVDASQPEGETHEVEKEESILVQLLPRVEEAPPEGGTLEVGASDGVNVHNDGLV